MPKKQGRAPLPWGIPWQDIRVRKSRFIGQTMEIFRDFSFGEMLHEFTRGTIEKISWDKNGEISRIWLKNCTQCLAGSSGLRKWEPSNIDSFYCNFPPWYPITRKASDLRKDVWLKDKVVLFRTQNGVDVAIFPKGTSVPKKPFFYKTPKQQKEDSKEIAKWSKKIAFKKKKK